MLCSKCKRLAQLVGAAAANPHLYCPSCGFIMEHTPVAVVALAEHEALLRLKTAVEDDALAHDVVSPPHPTRPDCWCEGCITADDQQTAIDAYRAVLRERAKGGA